MIYKSIIEAMSANELRNYARMQEDLELAMDDALKAKDDLIEVLSHLFDVERREQVARGRLVTARHGQMHMCEMMIRKHQDALCGTENAPFMKPKEAADGEQ